ncbi:MAG: nucleotidyltransferase [Eubacteriales bacterium]
MKLVGLIVEYNPFHNGHLYHIEESLKCSGADKAIVIMSGNFVQRGAPAIIPKHIRAEMALKAGVSVVLELPTRYATGSAEYFAMGAVSTLNALGCVDSICFGSESGDIEKLTKIAELLIKEPEDYRSALQEYLRTGISFPAAREYAMRDYLTAHECSIDDNLLNEPNNILGIEYLKALIKLNSSMKAYTITRKTSHYHDTELQDNYSSASAIRTYMNLNESENIIREQMPLECYELLVENNCVRYPISTNDFSLLLHQKLLTETADSLVNYLDMTDELANRIMKNRNHFRDVEQFIQILKTKNLTHSRLSRVLFHVLLQIPNYKISHYNFVRSIEFSEVCFYIRVLGFLRCDSEILTKIKQNAQIPIITKLTAIDTLSQEGQTLLNEDVYAANLYESVVTNKFQNPFIHEYEQSIIIL